MYNNLRTKVVLSWNDVIGTWLRETWTLRQSFPISITNRIKAEYLLNGNANDTTPWWGTNWSATSVTWWASSVWYTKETATFNGSAYINITNNSAIEFWNNESFSLSLWFNHSSAGSFETLFSTAWFANPWFQFTTRNSGDNITFTIWDSGGQTGYTHADSFADWEWHHAVCIRNITSWNAEIRIDNSRLVNTANTRTGSTANTETFCIWQFHTWGANRYNWDAALIRVCSWILSVAEIDVLYKEGLTLLH